MKIKFTFWQELVFLCVLCCVGCSKFDEELTPNVTDEISGRMMTRSGVAEGEELVILGEKLVNPFTVENMQAAYNILKAGAQEIGTVNISKPTHKYIKFMPQDSVQLELIEADTTLDLYSYPLDYEILSEGTDYIDPELPEGQPQYRYAAVPWNYTIPKNVNFQLLAELYRLTCKVPCLSYPKIL